MRVPVAELSDPHFRAGGVELFSADMFHPNAEGHRLWSQLFTPFVAAALDVREIADTHARCGA